MIDLRRRDDFYFAAQATLLTRPDQRDDFDRVFARFWPPTTLPLDSGESGPGTQPGAEAPGEEGARGGGGRGPALRLRRPRQPGRGRPADESRADPRNPATAVMSYSQEEVLRDKNFGDFTDDELARARRLMERMRWRRSAAPDPAPQPARQGDAWTSGAPCAGPSPPAGRPSPGPAGSAS